MAGATFKMVVAYAASGVVVADGAATVGTRAVSSATAAFTIADEGKALTIEGAGAAGADLVTTIIKRISATVVEIKDVVLTTVSGADLTYVKGRYRIRNLLKMGDVDGHTYDILNVSQLQIQVNSASPAGTVSLGGPNVTPTNVGVELDAILSDNFGPGGQGNQIVTTEDYLAPSAANALVNIFWHGATFQ